jgi:hypothetical protein
VSISSCFSLDAIRTSASAGGLSPDVLERLRFAGEAYRARKKEAEKKKRKPPSLERRRGYQATYRAKNKDKTRLYVQKNMAVILEYKRKRYAAKKGAPVRQYKKKSLGTSGEAAAAAGGRLKD